MPRSVERPTPHPNPEFWPQLAQHIQRGVEIARAAGQGDLPRETMLQQFAELLQEVPPALRSEFTRLVFVRRLQEYTRHVLQRLQQPDVALMFKAAADDEVTGGSALARFDQICHVLREIKKFDLEIASLAFDREGGGSTLKPPFDQMNVADNLAILTVMMNIGHDM
jgi:hypothetical protein